MDRKIKTIRFLFFVVLVLGLVWAATYTPRSDGFAKLFVLDVGQGDSIFIQAANGRQVLIDGGRDEQALVSLSKIMPRNDRHIDVVIATHPDADHIGGFPTILSRYDVGLFLFSAVKSDTDVSSTVTDMVEEKRIPAYSVRSGMQLLLDETLLTSLTFLFPDRPTDTWETNSASVVARLRIGNRSALLTGDAPVSIENYLVEKNPNMIDVDILKLGHHGSKTSSGQRFLERTSPRLAIVSAGANNRYGHPAPEVIDRVKMLGIPIVSTAEEGTITLFSDGEKWFRK